MTLGHLIVGTLLTTMLGFAYLGAMILYDITDLILRIRIVRTPR